jgi:hypothetical protein
MKIDSSVRTDDDPTVQVPRRVVPYPQLAQG